MRQASWHLFLYLVAVLDFLLHKLPSTFFNHFLLVYFLKKPFLVKALKLIVKLLLFIFHMHWKYFSYFIIFYWICVIFSTPYIFEYFTPSGGLHHCMMLSVQPVALWEERPGRTHIHCKTPCTRCDEIHYFDSLSLDETVVTPCPNAEGLVSIVFLYS